jgi:hypothetical protein
MKNSFLFVGTALLFASAAGTAVAAPSAPSTNSVFSNGASIILKGSSFGVGQAPMLWSTMESGVVGSVLNTSPDVGTWYIHGDRTKYTSSDFHSGNRSAYSIRNAGASGYYNVRTSFDSAIQHADKIYFSFGSSTTTTVALKNKPSCFNCMERYKAATLYPVSCREVWSMAGGLLTALRIQTT